jgi:hypothetical protein
VLRLTARRIRPTPARVPGCSYAAVIVSPRLRPAPTLILACALVCALCGAAAAAPYTPASDAEVLERIPARATDPAARELLALRRAWLADPLDLGRALRLAGRYFEETAASGDPRHIGHAQAALQPWWALASPPPAVRLMRAQLLQFDHRFEPALADLKAVLEAEPGNAQAWSWRLAIEMVQADYAGARHSCEQLAARAPALIGVACRAQVDAATGHAAAAAAALQAALQAEPVQDRGASAAARSWCLTRLAEIEERRGDAAAAEAAFRAALGLGQADVYLRAAYADFLLDRSRAAEVLALLQDRGRADVLLLRLALAARAAAAAGAADLERELAARFEAARQRGDTSHRKEEARYLLGLRGDAPRALQLARENWAGQREAADARILLEAALAARDRAAAAPVLQWLDATGYESVALRALAGRLKELP